MMKKAISFLSRHRLLASDINMEDLVKVFTEEMIDGLGGIEGALRMIPTYIEADNKFRTDIPVLAIDAGGTNFRAALLKFSADGKTDTGEIAAFKMPGLDREISSWEFFGRIAGYIKPLADKTDCIGFCFSYPTEILPDRDGKLIQFCKEVHAPEVVGQLIGKTLLRTLGSPEKKIVLLNDTVATLLAGKSRAQGKKYDSFIGYILGTGTNTCYIEKNCNILKNRSLDQRRSQIINIESGNFRKAPLTDIDLLFDKTTTDPGSYTFEKMFSGGYFGRLCLFVIKVAATEGIFSDRTAGMIAGINDLSSNEANGFLLNPESRENILSKCFYGNNEGEICRYIIETIIDRAAKLVASSLAAVVLKTGKGKDPECPVLITVEGTTFYKLCDLKSRFESYFYEFLSGERKRFVEFTEVAQSGLVGAGLAALIE